MGAMPATNEGVSLTTDIDSHEVTDGSSLPALNSACNGAFQLLRFSLFTRPTSIYVLLRAY